MNYFETNEKNDLQLLYEFNYKKHLFNKIIPTKEKCQYDAIATHKNRTFVVELKRRYVKLEKYSTMFIEDYKMAALLLEWQINKKEPLYICFLHDAILIYNLLKLKEIPKLRITNIRSEGYDVMQVQERRYLLPIEDAVIYKIDKTLN